MRKSSPTLRFRVSSGTLKRKTACCDAPTPRLIASVKGRHGKCADAVGTAEAGADASESISRADAEELSFAQQQALDSQPSPLQSWLYPEPSELSEDFQMPIWDHLDELRERVLVAALAGLVAVLTCFCFSKDLVVFLEAPVVGQGVKFLQLSPGEFFFTTLQVLLAMRPERLTPADLMVRPALADRISPLQPSLKMHDSDAAVAAIRFCSSANMQAQRGLHPPAQTVSALCRWPGTRGCCWRRRRCCTRSLPTWCRA